MILMKLGEYAFEITTTAHSKLSKKAQWRWKDIERLGQTSVLHYGGRDPRSITLDGAIFTQLAGEDGLTAFDRLEAEADKGEPLLLVDALGNNLGRWVIVSVDMDETGIRQDNTARRIDFKLEIKKYEDL